MKQFSQKSLDNAIALINDGKFDTDSDWSFSPEDGNKILGDPANWKKFARWHLGSEFGVPEEDKGFYSFPYGKNGKVYRSALVAIKQRAGQTGDGEIQKAANDLLELIEEQAGVEPVVAEANIISGELPKWLQVAPYGDYFTSKGRFIMFEADAQNVINEFNKYFANNDMPIDYQHSSDKPGVKALAGAWVDKLEYRGETGLWAHVNKYTRKAAGHVKDGEYRYISPIIYVDKVTRRAKFLRNAAFTNEPAFRGMVPLVAEIGNDLPHAGVDKQEVEGMEEILKLLGLQEGADSDAILEAIRKLKERAEGAEGSVAEHAPMVASVGELFTAFEVTDMGALVPLVMSAQTTAAEAVSLREQITTLEDELKTLAGAGVDAIVAEAVKDGKLLPSQVQWATALGNKDKGALEAFVAEAPAIVPVTDDAALEAARKKAAQASASNSQTEEGKLVMEALGITDEMVEEFGPKAIN